MNIYMYNCICIKTENPYFRSLNIIPVNTDINLLSIEYQSYQRSTKSDAFEQKIYICHSSNNSTEYPMSITSEKKNHFV